MTALPTSIRWAGDGHVDLLRTLAVLIDERSTSALKADIHVDTELLKLRCLLLPFVGTARPTRTMQTANLKT